jgi:hypothetical protein
LLRGIPTALRHHPAALAGTAYAAQAQEDFH